MTDRPQVFVSHSSDDILTVSKLKGFLGENRIPTWVDHREISGGDSLGEQIGYALEKCNVFLLIWSKSAAKSHWVKREWNCAVKLNKDIVVCLQDDTRVPTILAGDHHLDFRVGIDFDKLLLAFERHSKQKYAEIKNPEIGPCTVIQSSIPGIVHNNPNITKQKFHGFPKQPCARGHR